jgi:DNA polymerase (family 10)
LSIERIAQQAAEIARLNKELAPFRIFHGIESDILADGALDYPDEILARLDFVVASIHSRLSMSREEMTARVIRAVENRFTTVLGHPTGRRLLRREASDIDLEAVLQAAAKHGVTVEINGSAQRLDLDWRWHTRARELGVLLAVTPDAHAIEEFQNIAHSVTAARKGGCTADEILTCRGREELAAYFAARRDRNS